MTAKNLTFLKRPTYKQLLRLYDNYERNINAPENYTRAKFLEERDYINSIYGTPPIQKLRYFLVCKGMLSVRFTGVVFHWHKLTRA